ncbi:hypothetical protein D9M68_552210 [compost metagenome]
MPSSARKIDDSSAPDSFEVPKSLFAERSGREEIDLEISLPSLRPSFFVCINRDLGANACIIDEAVNSAGHGLGFAPKLKGALQGRQVRLDDPSLPPDFGEERLGTCLVTTEMNDWLGTFLHEALDDRGTDSAGGPCYKNVLSKQRFFIGHRFLPLSKPH